MLAYGSYCCMHQKYCDKWFCTQACAVAAARLNDRVVYHHTAMSSCQHQSALIRDACVRIQGIDLRHFPQLSRRDTSRVSAVQTQCCFRVRTTPRPTAACTPSSATRLVIQQSSSGRKGQRFPSLVAAFQSDVPLEQQIEPPASGPKFRPFTPQVMFA